MAIIDYLSPQAQLRFRKDLTEPEKNIKELLKGVNKYSSSIFIDKKGWDEAMLLFSALDHVLEQYQGRFVEYFTQSRDTHRREIKRVTYVSREN